MRSSTSRIWRPCGVAYFAAWPARGESWPSVSVDRYLPVRNPSRARSTARARAELLRDRDDVVLGLAVDEVVVRLDRDGLGDAEVTCDAHPRADCSAE
jgi:hypothetical protein